MRKTAEERFWAFVEKTSACWVWKGPQDKDGYGVFTVGYKTLRAHRFSLELKNLKTPVHQVLHKCDNPSCVRPDHLFEGTAADNMRDKLLKGRHVSGMARHPERAAKGVDHGMGKLTEEAVIDIRTNYVPRKVPLKFFSEKYGVTVTCVLEVVKKRTWKHLGDNHVR